MPTLAPGRDLRTELKTLLSPPRRPVLVDVPELSYLMIDGTGAPEEAAGAPPTAFQEAIMAMYPVAYTLKFGLKRDGIESKVMPLEALWWAGDGDSLDVATPRPEWRWRLLLIVPDEVTPERFGRTVAEVRQKRDPIALGRVRLERWREGRSAQVMHIGPYSAEPPTIEALHAFITAEGLVLKGAHHEIYLGDPRTAAPERLKTIIRHPVASGS